MTTTEKEAPKPESEEDCKECDKTERLKWWASILGTTYNILWLLDKVLPFGKAKLTVAKILLFAFAKLKLFFL